MLQLKPHKPHQTNKQPTHKDYNVQTNMFKGHFFSCLLKKNISSAQTILESLSAEQLPTSVC